jgi:tryptophan synthase beta chain
VACVGGGSNAIGLFTAFRPDPEVALVGVEAAGHGIATGQHAATLSAGRPGVLHGAYSYVLQDAAGQILPAHSISAGLDYPGVGPEHSHLKETGRATYVSATDDEALAAFVRMAHSEGIILALETAHALAAAITMAGRASPDDLILVSSSGRGDKDMESAARALKLSLPEGAQP